MDISGTLHFYSGQAKELFFVFDDDIAQNLYTREEFNQEDIETRRCYISVGSDRLIHRRTLSFSRKQTEVKISLCSKASKDDLDSLTTLYDWFGSRGARPEPFSMLGKLKRIRTETGLVWELFLTEPLDLIVPPGILRRTKVAPSERKSFEKRRVVASKGNLDEIGRSAELLALELARTDYPSPRFSCLWRDSYLDSEQLEIRKLGIIADIDVWDAQASIPEAFLEIKAQKVASVRTPPAFYLSVGERRSYNVALQNGIPYILWLFRYKRLEDFAGARHHVELMVFDQLDNAWFAADGYLVHPEQGAIYTLD